MDDFTIALVQHASPVGRKKANLAATIAWTRQAKEQGADLVCFPELGLTGHAGAPAMVAEWEPVPDGPAVETLCSLARELDIHISAGIAENDNGVAYNTQFVVGPAGFVGKQRKVHLSGDEYLHFRHGTALPVFELPFVRLGVIICYDNHFPEIARCLTLDGAELLFAPHAARFGAWSRTADGRRRAVANQKASWRKVHACRAYDNGCYVALCNTAGRSAARLPGVEANHAGGCMVVDPDGEVIAESDTSDIEDEMLVVELAGASVARRPSNLRNRRPEVFGRLTAPSD